MTYYPLKVMISTSLVPRQNALIVCAFVGFSAVACVAHAAELPSPTRHTAQVMAQNISSGPVKMSPGVMGTEDVPPSQISKVDVPANLPQNTKETDPVKAAEANSVDVKPDAVTTEPERQVKPVKPPKLPEPKKKEGSAILVDSEKANNARRDINLDTPPNPVVVTPGTELLPSMSSMALSMLLDSNGATEKDNRVVSPVSLISALGLVHAGAAGPTADELSDLVAPKSARRTALQNDIPQLLKQLMGETEALTSANRLWLDTSLTKAVSPKYLKTVNTRYAADAALLSFGADGGKTATEAINQWATTHTKDRIKNLLPAGVINANTQAVLTNALRFRNPWATAFDPAATAPVPFMGMKQPVPTMRKAMEVGVNAQAGVTLYELPFKSPAFSFRVAMEPTGDTRKAAQVLLGSENKRASFTQKSCVVLLPRFTLQPKSQSLKPWLQAKKVTTVFSSQADFSPLLGDKAKLVQLSDVFQSAGIEVQEGGVEAIAATAAVATKRFVSSDPSEVCAIDRPFAFAIVHNASGTPLFVGRVTQP